MYTPNFVHEVYDLYWANAQSTKRIGRVHQVYSRYKVYRPCTLSIPFVRWAYALYRSYTSCTGRMLNVQSV